MGWFKKIVSGVKDVAKAVSYVVVAPINSGTSHKYRPKYETRFGNAVGNVLENSVDNVHALAKAYSDTLLGGLPTRIANKFRSADNQESPGHYLENSKDYGNKILNGLNRFSALAGSYFGARVANSNMPDSSPPGTPPVDPVDVGGVMKVVLLIVGIYLILKLIFNGGR